MSERSQNRTRVADKQSHDRVVVADKASEGSQDCVVVADKASEGSQDCVLVADKASEGSHDRLPTRNDATATRQSLQQLLHNYSDSIVLGQFSRYIETCTCQSMSVCVCWG